MSPVKVLRVAQPPLSGTDLLAAHVDAPAPESELDGNVLEIAGWVVPRQARVISVEARCEDRLLRSMILRIPRPDVTARLPEAAPETPCGFQDLISLIGLPSEFRLTLHATLANGNRVSLGAIDGIRPPPEDSPAVRLRPLMVTTLGRTGSTWLIRLLGSHPGIVACPPFVYEARILTYWMEVLRTLCDPQSYLRQLVPGAELAPRWWLGDGMHDSMARLKHGTLEARVGTDQVGAVAAFCRERIEAVYLEVARRVGREEARYFAEKVLPGRLILDLAWEMYPSARELVLVRDFRDMLCSILAFNRRRGTRDFGQDQAGSDEEYVRQLAGSVTSLLAAWQARSDRSHLVRYEDLVLRPSETLRKLFLYLGLDAKPSTVDGVLSAAAGPDAAMKRHRTTPDVKASVGRWRSDLDPKLRAVCNGAFGDALEAFGYHGSTWHGKHRPPGDAERRTRERTKEEAAR